jgi:FtsH-binding integral membrane protein
MTVAVAVIIYVVFCILTGLCGSQRRMGFFGTFIMSLFLTPIVVLIVLKLTAPSERVEWRHRPQND